MNFSFNIEDDTLFLNVTTPTEEEDTFTIKKTPIINKEAFAACFKYWILQEQEQEPVSHPMPPFMQNQPPMPPYEPEIVDHEDDTEGEDEDDTTAE